MIMDNSPYRPAHRITHELPRAALSDGLKEEGRGRGREKKSGWAKLLNCIPDTK